jgi:nucleotide-binding universal stress UspA family protein
MHFERILVPVDGSPSDVEAMELACSLAGEDSTIYAVHVISIGRALPLDAEVETEINKAEELLAGVEAIARKNDCQIETDLLQARDVGPAIVDEVSERGIDLILIGSSYKTHFGEFCLGDIIPYLLRNAPCRVIVDQQRDV